MGNLLPTVVLDYFRKITMHSKTMATKSLHWHIPLIPVKPSYSVKSQPQLRVNYPCATHFQHQDSKCSFHPSQPSLSSGRLTSAHRIIPVPFPWPFWLHSTNGRHLEEMGRRWEDGRRRRQNEIRGPPLHDHRLAVAPSPWKRLQPPPYYSYHCLPGFW